MNLSRRETLIGSLAFAGFGLAATPYAQTGRRPDDWRFFSPEEARFVEAAVERLIPGEPGSPGALEAGCAQFIDWQLAGPFGQGDRLFLGGPHKPGLPQQGYQLGLNPAELYRVSIRSLRAQGVDLAARPPEQRDADLTRIERGELQTEGFSSAIFFETLLTNTIEGFFADPAYGGNRDMAGWRLVGFPGAYAGYLDIYTQHGVAFTREPLAMSDSTGHGHGHGHADPQPTGAAPRAR